MAVAESKTQRRTYKYRINPNKTTVKWLEQTFETHRRLYNDALAWHIHEYEVYGNEPAFKCSTFYDQRNAYAKRRHTNPFMQRCTSDSLWLTIDRLDKAFKSFFKRAKKGGPPGFPRFKGRDQLDSIAFPRNTNQPKVGTSFKGLNITPPEDGEKKGRCKFTIMEAGKVVGHHVARVVWHRPLPDGNKIKQASIVREGNKWFVCLSMEVPEPVKSCGQGTVGVDVGLKEFLVTSDGDTMGSTRHLEDNLKDLRVRQRALSRKTNKRSNRRRKAREHVARLHRKVANCRKHEQFNVAKQLFDRYETVAVEDLNVKGMMQNGRLARRIADAGWYSFRLKLESTAAKRGGKVIAVAPHNTSQDCSGCGTKVPKSLSVRTHECPHCGLTMDRDQNAAVNIARKAQ